MLGGLGGRGGPQKKFYGEQVGGILKGGKVGNQRFEDPRSEWPYGQNASQLRHGNVRNGKN